MVFEKSGLVEEGAGGFDFGVHVGEHPLNGLEFGNGFTEGFAGAGIFDGFVQGALGKANRLRGDANAAAVEGGECDPEALAFFADAIFGGNHAIVEKNFDGGRGALAHFVFVAADFEAGGLGFDEEGANSLPGQFGLRFSEDDVEASVGAVGDPGFGAVEAVVVAAADGGGLDAGGVGAGGRLGETEGAENFPGGEAAEIAGFLGFVAKVEDRDLRGGIGDAKGGGHGGMDAGDFFEHEDVGDGIETGAAPFFWHEHAAAAESTEFLDGFEGKVVGALPIFDVRADLGVHEVADGVADEELVVREGEVHG